MFQVNKNLWRNKSIINHEKFLYNIINSEELLS